MQIETDSRIVMPTGGSGGVSIIDKLLDKYPNVTSITGVGDDGGHSRFVRSELGTLPPGDASHQLAVHIRNLRSRQLFTFRWAEGARKGVRTGSEMLAVAERLAGSHSGGIKDLEALLANYLGRVIPISDDDLYLRPELEDGTFLEGGEPDIDNMKFGESPIKVIHYVNKNKEIIIPRINPEAADAAANSEFFIIPPGTFWGSQMQIANMPGFAEAVQISRGPIIMICNSVNTPETEGYTTSTFAEKFAKIFGRPIDLLLVDKPQYRLPKNYWPPSMQVPNYQDFEEAGRQIFVQNDLRNGNEFVRKIVEASLTRVALIGDKYVLRHDGLQTIEVMEKGLASL